MKFGSVSEVRDAPAGDRAWRVTALTSENAGAGLVHAYTCLFTIPNYWEYGYFSSRSRCRLPGKLFVAKASGTKRHQHHFMAPASADGVYLYRMAGGRMHHAWRVKAPTARVEGGRFSLVSLADGPWELWCNRDEQGRVVWTVRLLREGDWGEENLQAEPEDGWFNVHVIADPHALTVRINGKERGTFGHDVYAGDFFPRFGSGQAEDGGGDVISEYRNVFVHTIPYPDGSLEFAEGPEDIRPGDNAVVGHVCEATPQAPRLSEGDMIELKDGSLLAAYSYYYAGAGWDGSPARLAARVSHDGGRTWGESWTVADREEGSLGNVMSASLLRAENGDILLVYMDNTPAMPARGMVLRRSSDEGRTWSARVSVTPNNGNRHLANNACLTRLSTGRILLAAREYVDGIRWPYVCISDDDGRTWRAGEHVPDPGLSPDLKRGQNVNEPVLCELGDGRLLMTMRSIAGGQFFSWSADGGETWTRPVLSPLRGTCSPAIVRRIPGTDDVLAVWTYGFADRTPLVSAVSGDGGLTWKHLKLLEQSEYHGYCYASCIFQGDRVLLTYARYPLYESLFRFEVQPGYKDLRFISLPLDWFYRAPE